MEQSYKIYGGKKNLPKTKLVSDFYLEKGLFLWLHGYVHAIVYE